MERVSRSFQLGRRDEQDVWNFSSVLIVLLPFGGFHFQGLCLVCFEFSSRCYAQAGVLRGDVVLDKVLGTSVPSSPSSSFFPPLFFFFFFWQIPFLWFLP